MRFPILFMMLPAITVLLGSCGAPAASPAEAPTPTNTPPPTATPTPSAVPPSITNLTVNGTELIPEDAVYRIPGEINPGDELSLSVLIEDDDSGMLEILGSEHRYALAEGNQVEISLDLLIPEGLLSNEIPLLLRVGEDIAEYALTFEPGPEWAPLIFVDDPTGLTGEVLLEVLVVDLNGAETAELAGVEQEFNPQATGDREITEYISNRSIAPITVEQTGPGLYVVRFRSDYPGRFPLHLTATDAEGNLTTDRVPVEVYWAEQPFEIRGIWTGFLHDDSSYYSEYIQAIDSVNANLLAIEVDGRTPSLTSSEVSDLTTATPQNVERLISLAEEHDIDVMLKLGIMVGEWQPTWMMNPDWSEFFSLEEGASSYSNWVLQWARFAEEHGVEYFSMGNEMTTSYGQRQAWEDLISAIREVYTGKLTYADNYWVFFSADDRPFPACALLDFMGLNFYYRGSGGAAGGAAEMDPSQAEMEENLTAQVERFLVPGVQACGGIPVIITEMGMGPIDGGNTAPERGYSSDVVLDLIEQAEYTMAVLNVMSGYPWFRGAVVGQYQAVANPWSELEWVPGDIRGLPVEQALRIFYAVGDGSE